jgi:hypothetical protein
MADIDVVPKKKTNLWLWWILAAIIVALILFMLFGSSDAPSAVGEMIEHGAMTATIAGSA